MKCDISRKEFNLGKTHLAKMRAWLHLRMCSSCRDWLAEQRATEKLLESMTSHEIPATLQSAIRESISTSIRGGSKMSMTQQIGRKSSARKGGILTLRRVAIPFVIILAALIWLSIGRKGETIAWAQMSEALSKPNIVRMTGFCSSLQINNGKASLLETMRKDKCLRRNPVGYDEYQEPADMNMPDADRRRLRVVSDAEKTYWYFPGQGKVSITKPIRLDFIQELTTIQGWQKFWGSEDSAPVEESGELNGKKVLIISLDQEGGISQVISNTRLYVDPETKLVLRAEQFGPDASGKQRKVTSLDFVYDPPVPPGTFEFTIPAGVEVKDKR